MDKKTGFLVLSGIICIILVFCSYFINQPNESAIIASRYVDNNIEDSVTPFANILNETEMSFNTELIANDYESIMYYSDNVVVAKVVRVEGVKNTVVSGDETYSAAELKSEFPELTSLIEGKVENPVDTGDKPVNPEGQDNFDVEDYQKNSMANWSTVWVLDILEVISGEGVAVGDQIELTTSGFPNTKIGDAPQYRDGDILVFALDKNPNSDGYWSLPMNQDYLVKTNRLRSGNSLENNRAFNELENLSETPKEELDHVEIFGDLTTPPKEGR
ncbi:hypothetical protein [Culicoidibacter larvae]|uniref:Uncharacterized protein n=1 Tax=Culicoidibacter larvae TaxID=2579976 RepID=A0A5R8QAQ4_9FIRM|nr:hypothetical protein [Culicoidibacter larvae]TLG72739.1 hypothetical protein FEZ08_08535 [Culicoidibacter larvae]